MKTKVVNAAKGKQGFQRVTTKPTKAPLPQASFTQTINNTPTPTPTNQNSKLDAMFIKTQHAHSARLHPPTPDFTGKMETTHGEWNEYQDGQLVAGRRNIKKAINEDDVKRKVGANEAAHYRRPHPVSVYYQYEDAGIVIMSHGNNEQGVIVQTVDESGQLGNVSYYASNGQDVDVSQLRYVISEAVRLRSVA